MDKVTKGDLQKKLKYLKLDLEKIPEQLTEYKPLNFNVSRLNNDKDHRVFRYVPIDKIEILFTPCLRTDPLKEKYSKAVPLFKYILPAEKEEDIGRYTTFLKMLDKISIPEIENIANIQKELEKKEPFRIKYNKDHLWQIYYSEATGLYFMLVCTKEDTFAEFFYLLKLQLEYCKKRAKNAPKIYVPINAMNYSEEYLNRMEIADLENYLWLFTKDWALSFEVYDKNNNLSLQITGDTYVYDKVKSTYKVKLNNREEALKFYKLLKALFIMQTEIKNHFNFTTKIDSNNGLELYMGQTRLTYDMLTDFIRSEVQIAEEEIKNQNIEIEELEKELLSIKDVVQIKEDEYLVKQKEISTFLEYKKTFIGKVKYFFKSSKINKKIKYDQDLENSLTRNNKEIQESEVVNIDPMSEEFKNKKFYTIEDLVTICSLLEKGQKTYKNLKQDLKAQKLKLENLISKVKNATLYIEESRYYTKKKIIKRRNG